MPGNHRGGSALYYSAQGEKALTPSRPQIRPYLCAFGYAVLVFMPLHEPGLLAASLLQLTICACLLGLLLLFLTYRNEIRELFQAAFCACADRLIRLLPVCRDARKQYSVPALPVEPFRRALFQRPPPIFA